MTNQQRQLLLGASGLLVIFLVLFLYKRSSDTSALKVEPLIKPLPQRFSEKLDEIADGGGKTLEVTEYPVDDDMFRGVERLVDLETVILDQGSVTDRSIAVVSQLSQLRHLRLRLSPITDVGFSQIASCESLWYLNVPHADCTIEGIHQLSKLPALRQLRLGSSQMRLGSSQMGNDVVSAIAKIESLRSVHLIGIPVNDEGLKDFAKMSHLQSLYLDDSEVTETGWEWLFENAGHLHVHVNQKHHDRDPDAHSH